MQVYGARGETDRAFTWLEHAFVQHDAGLSELKPQPLLHSLRADPRWDKLLHKMGLADEGAIDSDPPESARSGWRQ